MPRCDEMREGDIYYCEQCGLEVEVVEECVHDDDEDADEVCTIEEFTCCGQPMSLKDIDD